MWSYAGRQHRWLLVAQAVALLLVTWSMLRFGVSRPALVLYLVIPTLYLVCMGVSLLSSTRGKEIERADHEVTYMLWQPADGTHPSVDVFLPSAGEPLDVLGNTYRHV